MFKVKNTDMQPDEHPSCKFIYYFFYLLMQLIQISTCEQIGDIFVFLFIFVFTDLYHDVLIFFKVCGNAKRKCSGSTLKFKV